MPQSRGGSPSKAGTEAVRHFTPSVTPTRTRGTTGAAAVGTSKVQVPSQHSCMPVASAASVRAKKSVNSKLETPKLEP